MESNEQANPELPTDLSMNVLNCLGNLLPRFRVIREGRDEGNLLYYMRVIEKLRVSGSALTFAGSSPCQKFNESRCYKLGLQTLDTLAVT